MLMLDNSCIRHNALRIVDDRISLIIVSIVMLVLEPHAPVFEITETEIIVLVNHACIDCLLSYIRIDGVEITVIGSQNDLRVTE